MRDFKLNRRHFDSYDLAMGGHIHLRQRFAPRAAYCGSLIQQNIGESHHGHGYVMWELVRSGEHSPFNTAPPMMRGIDVPNAHGFVRVELDDEGEDITHMPLPATPLYWEMLHGMLTPMEAVEQALARYSEMFGMQPRAIRERPNKSMQSTDASASSLPSTAAAERSELVAAQEASRTLASHESIIRDLLRGDDDLADGVIALHRSRWTEPRGSSGGKFRLLRLEFDNMYAFGPMNVVDFTILEGCISGVVAPNHTGKSSLIEALLFALYEEHPRAPSKKDVVHRGAGSCRLVLTFELDGKVGRIEKGVAARSHAVESCYRFEFAGEDRTRGGTVDTLREIDSVLGSSAGALASSFQLQGGESGGFVGSNPAGRKKLLASVMSLGSFDSIERVVAKELTAAGGEMKALEVQFLGVSSEDLETSLDAASGDHEDAVADSEKARRAADEAQGAAIEAAHALGMAAAGTATCSKAVEDAATALKRVGCPVPLSECEIEIAGWSSLLGELTPEELQSGRSIGSAMLRSAGISSIPTAADVVASDTAARLAEELLAHAELTMQGKSDARAEVVRAQADVNAHAATLERLRTESRRPAPAPPAVEKPEGDLSGAERSGPRPTPEEHSAAMEAIKNYREDMPPTREWSPAEYGRILTAIENGGPPTAEAAAQQESQLRAEAKLLQSRATAAAEVVIARTEKLTEVTAWREATTHVDALRGRLRPVAGCEGCQHAGTLLGSKGSEDARIAVARAAAALTEAKASSAQAAAAVEENAAAIKRASTFAAIFIRKAELERARARAEYTAAVSIIERANYHRAKDRAAWEAYENDVLAAAATEAMTASAIELATHRHEAAVASLLAAVGRAASEAERETLSAAAKRARGEHREGSALRLRGVAALIEWKELAEQARASEALVGALAASEEALRDAQGVLDRAGATAAAAAEKKQNADAKLTAAQSRVAVFEKLIDRLEDTLAKERSRAEQYEEAARRYQTLKAYKAVLRPSGGIGDCLLERGRAVLDRRINEGLRELGAKFSAEILPDYDIRLKPAESSDWLPSSLGSGYQKFVLSLAARLAIWRLSASARPDAFIIDEGFGACDEEYLEAMAVALETLASTPGGPRLVFLVSHVDALKVRLERTLEISLQPAGSRVANGCATESTRRQVAAAVAAVVAASPDDHITPDPAKAGNIYCEACRQSLSAGRKTQHVASAKHAAAVKKMLR
jgi:DNA repair exonuclease SbcCD ATPase subunit